jgi:hypothetical protein
MKLLAAVLSRITRTKLTDATSGFRLANRQALAVWAEDYPAEYLGDTVEALIIASRAGLRVTQAPVQMRPRAGGTPSHDALKSALFLFRAFLALLVGLTRPTKHIRISPSYSAPDAAITRQLHTTTETSGSRS